ncbi:MAG: DNA gyrase inhibitor YacG [Pseudomonadota bacterium]
MPVKKTRNPDNDNQPAEDVRNRKADRKPCPICAAPQSPSYRPFCSKRCADVDLNRWLSGAYAIPVVEDDELSVEDDNT